MNFCNEFITRVMDMQYLLMMSGGNLLNLEIDKESFDKLKLEFEQMMRYVSHDGDKPTYNQITLYGPMCKTIIRVKND